ncbi:MAG: hypothetical protein WD101_02890 [Gemmatimonadota bacterium]
MTESTRTAAARGGTVSPGYEAAIGGLAILDRSDRSRLRVHGRAPRQMLNGILTGTLPEPPAVDDADVASGTATYHAVLTPKGKMVTDLWAWLPVDEEGDGFLLDVPEAGAPGLFEHLRKVLPPRLARLDDVSADTGMLAVVGPEGAAALSRILFGLRIEADRLGELEEGGWLRLGSDGPVVVRSHDVRPGAFYVVGDRTAVAALGKRLAEAGAVAMSADDWDTLRVEAGRPAFGVDMTDATIPIEAGIHDRAIDHQKGCYTGQEVIVRIRDRGHVNRHLRKIALGDVPLPDPGTELFAPGDDAKAVGWVTSVVRSPTEGGVVVLAYVRRGVDTIAFAGREITVDSGSP